MTWISLGFFAFVSAIANWFVDGFDPLDRPGRIFRFFSTTLGLALMATGMMVMGFAIWGIICSLGLYTAVFISKDGFSKKATDKKHVYPGAAFIVTIFISLLILNILMIGLGFLVDSNLNSIRVQSVVGSIMSFASTWWFVMLAGLIASVAVHIDVVKKAI